MPPNATAGRPRLRHVSALVACASPATMPRRRKLLDAVMSGSRRMLSAYITDDKTRMDGRAYHVAAKGGAKTEGGARRTGPPGTPRLDGDGPRYENLLASGVSPASLFSGAPSPPPVTGPRPTSCLATPRTAQGTVWPRARGPE